MVYAFSLLSYAMDFNISVPSFGLTGPSMAGTPGQATPTENKKGATLASLNRQVSPNYHQNQFVVCLFLVNTQWLMDISASSTWILCQTQTKR